MAQATKAKSAPKKSASKAGFAGSLDKFFEITKRGSTIGTEVRGGLVIFITMAYIIILNPLILGFSPDVEGNLIGGGDPALGAIGAATALTAGVMSILFGVVARLPFAIAAGLGINSFLAVSIVKGVTWPEAMGLVVIEGILIVILASTGLRTMIFNAVPAQLKTAITVGIGLFIAFIGLVDAGFVRSTGLGAPPIGLGVNGVLVGIPTLTFIIGLILTAVLVSRKVSAGILIGLFATTIIAIILNAIWPSGSMGVPGTEGYNPAGWNLAQPVIPSSVFALPDLSIIGQVDIFGSFGRIGALAALMLVFTLLFSNFFDAMGTMTGLSKQAGLADKKGNFPRLTPALIVEGAGAVAGGLTSTSSNTVYIESASGIGGGARTGLASLVTGVLFVLAMFLTPLTQVVPLEVGAAALVIVGAMMMGQVVDIDWKDWSAAFPAFIAIIAMPLTYSIANGIGAGFIAWVVIRSLSGKAKEIHWLLWVVSAGFLLYFILPLLQQALAA